MIWSNNFVNIQLSCHCIWNVQKDTSEHFTICKGLFKLKHLFLVILVFWKNPGCSCSHNPAVAPVGSAGGWQHRSHLPWPCAEGFQQRLNKTSCHRASMHFRNTQWLQSFRLMEHPNPGICISCETLDLEHFRFLSSLNTHLSYTFTTGGFEAPAAFFKIFFFN